MLDIRLPIGALFTLIGIMLTFYGLASSPALYQRSLGINVNLEWGGVMLAFGIVMLVLGRRGSAEPDHIDPEPPPARNDSPPKH